MSDFNTGDEITIGGFYEDASCKALAKWIITDASDPNRIGLKPKRANHTPYASRELMYGPNSGSGYMELIARPEGM